ncbi:MAG TPA: ribonuclease J, partial [Candidatus Saccharimonadales bacterium]|nr:ribonuclease J [Candidatus Saccharimonadales bacterium]
MKTIKNSDATRQLRRKSDGAERLLRKHRTIKAAVSPADKKRIRIVPLGGQNGIGEKNMIVLEYGNDALILDCGFELGINVAGINYAIPVTQYLETIRHKLRGYVISHGHLDHIGGLVHILPNFPAPVFGSQFTIGMVRTQFEKATEKNIQFEPECHVMDMDGHQRITLGELTIELIRVTHSIPESSAIVIDTPAGRVINTGDFRLDPEPLDAMPSDITRLKQLGKEGVLLLMSESTSTTKPGRTPTEHTLQDSFYELVAQTKGRLFVAVFSSNMNRIQMTVNAAHHNGRKVALDGRSMMATAELAVRLGGLKIPKGTLVSMQEAARLPDKQLVVICTGGQGEPGAALSRMAIGEHQHMKLKKGDSVVVSSTPIPGNEISYQQIGDDLTNLGVSLFRHPTHQLDGCGPLHVSGHAARDEHAEIIQLTRPKYLMPIYGGALNRSYHRQIGIEQGIAEDSILMLDNGQVVELSDTRAPKLRGKVTSGALLVDQSGMVIPEIVTKDRILLQNDGFVIVGVTLSKTDGRLLSSPD